MKFKKAPKGCTLLLATLMSVLQSVVLPVSEPEHGAITEQNAFWPFWVWRVSRAANILKDFIFGYTLKTEISSTEERSSEAEIMANNEFGYD